MPTPNNLFNLDNDNMFAREYEKGDDNFQRTRRDSWQGTSRGLDTAFADDDDEGSIRYMPPEPVFGEPRTTPERRTNRHYNTE